MNVNVTIRIRNVTIYIELTLEEAQAYLAEMDDIELDSQQLKAVAGGYEKVFEWYKNTPGHRDLIFSYDVSEGRTDSHTAHMFFELLFTYMKEYFKVMGSEESAEYLKEFELRVPKGWRHIYYGLFKGRAAHPFALIIL